MFGVWTVAEGRVRCWYGCWYGSHLGVGAGDSNSEVDAENEYEYEISNSAKRPGHRAVCRFLQSFVYLPFPFISFQLLNIHSSD